MIVNVSFSVLMAPKWNVKGCPPIIGDASITVLMAPKWNVKDFMQGLAKGIEKY